MDRYRPTFLEFFAGAGLARLGLEGRFDCVFANDFDPMKAAAYRQNVDDDHFVDGDVWGLNAKTLPATDMAWASFPCQDLSLAGARKGLNAPRSGAFWGFWRLIEAMGDKAPPILSLENVPGLLTSRGGRDFTALVATLADAGYRVGGLVADAAWFTPQSRPRLFLIAMKGRIPGAVLRGSANPLYHPKSLVQAVDRLDEKSRLAWCWWSPPEPPKRNLSLIDVLDPAPPEDLWRSETQLEALITQMAPLHRARLDAVLGSPEPSVGAVFRRIRRENGERVQRAEIRFDGLAGCLRTPAGGSSKQLLIVVENGEAHLRPVSAREAARLMGVPDTFVMPPGETAGLKVMGDGVCVPVVSWLADGLLSPLAGTLETRAA